MLALSFMNRYLPSMNTCEPGAGRLLPVEAVATGRRGGPVRAAVGKAACRIVSRDDAREVCRELSCGAEEVFDLLLLGSEGYELYEGTEPGRHLSFSDHVRDLDPFERRRGCCEGLEAKHRP